MWICHILTFSLTHSLAINTKLKKCRTRREEANTVYVDCKYTYSIALWTGKLQQIGRYKTAGKLQWLEYQPFITFLFNSRWTETSNWGLSSQRKLTLALQGVKKNNNFCCSGRQLYVVHKVWKLLQCARCTVFFLLNSAELSNKKVHCWWSVLPVLPEHTVSCTI